MVGAVAVFPQVDALPGAQIQSAIGDWNADGGGRDGGPDMCRHVIGSFIGVDEQRVAIWAEPGKEGVEIPSHIGVGVFLYDKRGRGVVDKDVADARADGAGCDRVGHLGRDVSEAPARGCDAKSRLIHGPSLSRTHPS